MARARWRLEEHSHAAMAAAWAAGAAGLPFAVCAVTAARAVADGEPTHPDGRVPVHRRGVAAVPALRPDVAIVHAQRADRRGNVLVEGIVGVQKEVVLAAPTAVVTWRR